MKLPVLFGIVASLAPTILAQQPAEPTSNNGAFSYDIGFDTLAHACEAAHAAGRVLVVSRTWTNIASLDCDATLAFFGGAVSGATGGMIRFAPAAVFNTPVPAACGRQGFDISKSGPGSVLFTTDPQGNGSNPTCFGARGDGSHDDTLAIQAAIDATAVHWNAHTGYPATTFVLLPAGAYRITSGLRVYKAGTPHPASQAYENFTMRGAGKAITAIRYTGSPSTPAIRAVGAELQFSDFSIFDYSEGGWVSGLDYDGDSTIGRSTESAITNILIDCLSHAGDGITIGRSGYQADSLAIYHPDIRGCKSGRGVVSLNGNALSTVLYHPVIGGTWIGAASGTSTNMSIIGGEFDDNDVNFMPGAGSVFLVEGVRSEGSKRTMFTGAGGYQQAFTLQSYMLTSNNMLRPAATTSTSAGSTAVNISTPGFTFGDYIVIAGAGPNGADLHTKITAMSSLTRVTIDPAARASTSGSRVILDAGVNQNTLEENGGGPYVHIGNCFGTPAGGTVSSSNGPQVFIGNSWAMNISNPYGYTGSSNIPAPGPGTLFGNWYNSSPAMLMPNVGGKGGVAR